MTDEEIFQKKQRGRHNCGLQLSALCWRRAPPSAGELRRTLKRLAGQGFRHPIEGTAIRFGFATLERWYYAARKARDPVEVLRRRTRSDAG